MSADIWELPDLHRLDPGPVHSEWDVVLGLARGAARMTTDAFCLIDDPRVVHGRDTVARRGECLDGCALGFGNYDWRLTI